MQRRYGRQIAISIMMFLMLSVAGYCNDTSDTAIVNKITDCVAEISSNSLELQPVTSEAVVASESIIASEVAIASESVVASGTVAASESVDVGEAVIASENVNVSEITIASETVVTSETVTASDSVEAGEVVVPFQSVNASETAVVSENVIASETIIASETVIASESIDAALPVKSSSVWDKTSEWFFNAIASGTFSIEHIQASNASATESVFESAIRNSRQIFENSYFNIVREAFKTKEEIFAAAAELDLPPEIDLKAVKNLNQSFKFKFPCQMMEFQSSCATITPGLIKEEVWSSDYKSLVVIPEKMKMGTEYTITLATATLTFEGYPLKEAAVINFTTYSPEPASITMITPMNNAKNVATGATIILSFSKEIIWDPDYSPASFSVYNESSMQYVPLCPITAFNKKTLALIPENDLDIDSKYSVNVFEGIKTFVEDVDEGQPEVASATFTFSTSY